MRNDYGIKCKMFKEVIFIETKKKTMELNFSRKELFMNIMSADKDIEQIPFIQCMMLAKSFLSFGDLV